MMKSVDEKVKREVADWKSLFKKHFDETFFFVFCAQPNVKGNEFIRNW